MAFTQDNQYFSVTTPLGKDKLLFKRIRGSERLSGLFEYELEMLSEANDLKFKSIVGKNLTVTLEFTDGNKRYIHALVASFEQSRSDQEPDKKSHMTTYRAILRPWLWMLTLTRNSEIFQNMSTPEIIKKIFGDLSFKDFKDSLKGTYAKREYCVQYEETAFNFVSRLMEDEGIYYFFEHTDAKHTLVLADDLSVHKDVEGYASVRFWDAHEASQPEDIVFACTLSENVTTGKYAVDDFHFETPSTDLLSQVSGEDGKMRIYEYQGFQGGYDKKADGDKIAKKRIESLEWENKILRGESYCIGFGVGGKFTLKEHPRKDINDSYTICTLSISATLSKYLNSFEAIPAKSQFRPPVVARKPRISGHQTAIVTGPSGEEIYTDKYGRIKVQFHWDQLGKKDEKTTCFIRVNQSWAGKAWGRLFLPRIGQEVLVSFINGDPDRPVVTGALYNAEQTVPYALPANKTKSTWKTRSSKKGGVEDFNEIYFEDKKGEEKFYQHAQKDMKIMVENDRHKRVDNDEINDIKMNRTTTIEEKDDKLTIAKGNRTLTVKLARTVTTQEKDDKLTINQGSRIISIDEKDYKLTVSKGNRDIQVKKGKETHKVQDTRLLHVVSDETHNNDGDFSHTVKGNYTLKVTGNLILDVTGDIKVKGKKNADVKLGMNIKTKAGMNIQTQAGVNIKTKAGVNIDIKAGVMMKNTAGVMMKNKAGVMMDNKGGVMMKNEAGVMMKNKGGVMMINEGGLMLTNKAGLLGEVKAGAILMVKGGLVLIN
ncbi:type VI secretion system tip protein TssI/VgrG [Candidatus Venteria ishoeyi]|uniref:type VI secretion system Vgr family protein n=1 Tax=Candidatus Venteria ishoeyi TaxID=1899563 RepID=UPI0025A5D987|nr:type VI secretion system tip protein TssI/VgrG [Candidatus Venteria ishoeyi]MDM8545891.1 type VI secretion system tip protein TssI/VgrG [Candidatus Venteria ishoeyi]